MMGYLSVFAVLVLVQIAYGVRLDAAPPEEAKSSSEIRYYYPDQKSGNYYERKPDPPEHDDDDSKEDRPSNFDLYKPHKDSYVQNDEKLDSKYIPHSKRFSKYLGPPKSPNTDSKHSQWEDDEYDSENSKKSEEVPRYGFDRYKDDDDDYKHHEKQVEDKWAAKNPSPYKHEPKHTAHSYENADEYKHYEHDDEDHKTYPDHKEEDHHHYDNSNHEHSHHYDRDDHEDQSNHHGPDHSRYQHWSDRSAGAFPPLETDRVIEEVHKSKSHHIPSGPETNSDPWHDEKASYVPYVEDHIKEHSSHHKLPHPVDDDKSHHKDPHYISDSEKKYPFLKQYPHINKFHKEDYFKSFINHKPDFNFGGHHYSWMYRPRGDFYIELKKDLDNKMRLLKEHEDKLAELQKGHLEKYRALFEPPHAKKYFHEELPKLEIPNIEHKHYLHTDGHHEKYEHSHAPPKHDSHYEEKYEDSHAPPKHYDNYHKEPDYTSHKSDHHPHYETPHLRYEGGSEEPKHYSREPRPYKDDYSS